MEKSLDEMSQQELTEFVNGPGPNVPGIMPLDMDDDPIDHVRRVSQYIETAPEDRTVEAKAKENETHKTATKALNRFYQMIKGEIISNIVAVASFFTIDEDDMVKPTVRDYESSPYAKCR